MFINQTPRCQRMKQTEVEITCTVHGCFRKYNTPEAMLYLKLTIRNEKCRHNTEASSVGNQVYTNHQQNITEQLLQTQYEHITQQLPQTQYEHITEQLPHSMNKMNQYIQDVRIQFKIQNSGPQCLKCYTLCCFLILTLKLLIRCCERFDTRIVIHKRQFMK